MEKIITYFGQQSKVACDEKCNKAWGINNRPRNPEDEDEFLPDNQLGEAPIDPGTYEGGYAKPTDKSNIPNKWCVRECERCAISKPNESHLPLELPKFN